LDTAHIDIDGVCRSTRLEVESGEQSSIAQYFADGISSRGFIIHAHQRGEPVVIRHVR